MTSIGSSASASSGGTADSESQRGRTASVKHRSDARAIRCRGQFGSSFVVFWKYLLEAPNGPAPFGTSGLAHNTPIPEQAHFRNGLLQWNCLQPANGYEILTTLKVGDISVV